MAPVSQAETEKFTKNNTGKSTSQMKMRTCRVADGVPASGCLQAGPAWGLERRGCWLAGALRPATSWLLLVGGVPPAPSRPPSSSPLGREPLLGRKQAWGRPQDTDCGGHTAQTPLLKRLPFGVSIPQPEPVTWTQPRRRVWEKHLHHRWDGCFQRFKVSPWHLLNWAMPSGYGGKIQNKISADEIKQHNERKAHHSCVVK